MKKAIQSIGDYSICDAKNHHIPILHTIEIAATSLFDPASLPAWIFTDCLPLEHFTIENVEMLGSE